MNFLPAWLNPFALLMALVAGLGGYGAGRIQQYYADAEKHRVALLEAQVAAAKTTETLRTTHKETENDLRAKLEDASSLAERLADELRTRPSRLPPAARAACKGSTGAELSGGDAAAFARLGDRARLLQVELEACYIREEANYNALKPKE